MAIFLCQVQADSEVASIVKFRRIRKDIPLEG